MTLLQILANWGQNSRFVFEVNIKALISKSSQSSILKTLNNLPNNSDMDEPGPIAERSNLSFVTHCHGRGDPSSNPVVGWQTQ